MLQTCGFLKALRLVASSHCFKRKTSSQEHMCLSAMCVDMYVLPGLACAYTKVLRLRRGGLCWGGVPCSSWVFLSRGATGRTRDAPLGRPDSQCAVMGNNLTSRFCLLARP